MRYFLSLLLVFCAVLLGSQQVYADSGDSCNQFETLQSIILSEATRQPLEAQIEVARVAVTHGACELDGNFYSGYAIAERIVRDNPVGCIANTHCRAYHLLATIDPVVREPAAQAAYIALTEQPRVVRRHFDNWQSTATWWESLSACLHGWFIIAELKVC